MLRTLALAALLLTGLAIVPTAEAADTCLDEGLATCLEEAPGEVDEVRQYLRDLVTCTCPPL